MYWWTMTQLYIKLGFSCDVSHAGIGAVLFHGYLDGRERQIANVSRTLNETYQRYSEIHIEALAVILSIKHFINSSLEDTSFLVTDHKRLLALFGPNKEMPLLAANHLARWALLLSQYDYSVEFRKTQKHGNADALSRVPANGNLQFDVEEVGEDVDNVCTIHTISHQMVQDGPRLLIKETRKDPVLNQVMHCMKEGWPNQCSDEPWSYKKLEASLSNEHGYLFYRLRVVISASLQKKVQQVLYLCHFGMQRMKQLARSAVYWLRIDQDIERISQQCTAYMQSSRTILPNMPFICGCYQRNHGAGCIEINAIL